MTQTSSLSACTVEYRLYHVDNRFGAEKDTFRRKVIKINSKIRRFISNLGHRYLDLGKTDFTYNRRETVWTLIHSLRLNFAST